MVSVLNWICGGVRFLGSYAFAVVLIALLFILTFLGTLEQVNSGLHAVQKKYFESLYLVHSFWGIPVPLPGGLLVMTLFSINILVGGLIRIRKKKQTIGVIISHLGILTMLVGGLVTFMASDSGYMQLYETQAWYLRRLVDASQTSRISEPRESRAIYLGVGGGER